MRHMSHLSFIALSAIAWNIPPLLILWRPRPEPRWVVWARYISAILAVWVVAIFLAIVHTELKIISALLRDDLEIADTGAGAAALMGGWIVGFLYSTFLGIIRRIALFLIRRKPRITMP